MSKTARARVEASYVVLLHTVILAAGWEDHLAVFRDTSGQPRVDYVSEQSEALFRLDGRHERLQAHLNTVAQQVDNIVDTIAQQVDNIVDTMDQYMENIIEAVKLGHED